MLKRTFLHLPGVGPKRELAMWRAGVRTWEEFLTHGRQRLPLGLYQRGMPLVERSLASWRSPGGLAELAALLPAAEHWRFFSSLERVVYLDIETGGDPDEWGGITLVGLYDGARVRQYQAGVDLGELDHAMLGHQAVVTFAGTSFDLPVLRRVFGNLVVPPVHIDLRWPLKRLGQVGGLKRIERRLGLERPQELRELDGLDAVRLWRRYQESGDRRALDLLKRYNALDVLNLEPLLRLAARMLTARLLERL